MRTKTVGRENVVVGLDLGTTKIGVVIAEACGDQIKVLGVGLTPSGGLRRGVVIDVEKTVQAIRKAVSEAELMAGVEVAAVYAGIAGEHIASCNSRGVVAINGSEGEVTLADKERVIEAARAVSVEGGRQVLHVLPQEFCVDGTGGIRDPVGIAGVRLEASVHIVTGASTSLQNISKSILRAGYEVRGMVLEPLASSYAVLDEDEREMGVCLIDIGGGTTDVAFFSQGSIRHTGIIGLGGQNVTNDVAIGLRTSWAQAERVKCLFGVALADQVDKEEVIEVPGIAGRPAHSVLRRRLAEIIEMRVGEILELVKKDLRRAEVVGQSGVGVVLTGGGSLLAGIAELAERVFEMPVRLGLPRRLGGMSDRVNSPIFATALGLVLFGMEELELGTGSMVGEGASRSGWWQNVKEWIQAFS